MIYHISEIRCRPGNAFRARVCVCAQARPSDVFLGADCGAAKCEALSQVRYSKREVCRDRLMAAGVEGGSDTRGAGAAVYSVALLTHVDSSAPLGLTVGRLQEDK